MGTTSRENRQPVVAQAGDGEARWVFDSLVVIKTSAAETGGQLSIMEMADPPGEEFPTVVSNVFDLTYWILDGAFRMDVAGEAVHATPGTLVYIPRGCPHASMSGPDGCRYLVVVTPGGLEDQVRKLSRPAATPDLPPDAGPPMGGAELKRIAGEYGFEFVAR
jgi:mannose-6-phosphate isomerase-like protein (cupin superfamily)